MPLKTHCKRGHEMSGENLYTSPKGTRGCRACRSSLYLSADKTRKRFWYIHRTYGLTREQYELKLAVQNHRCPLCQRELIVPDIDHDHETNEVRDFLCHNCNVAVGAVREDISIAERLVLYLKKWKK